MTSKQNKDKDDMICTGNFPPPMAYAMEMYSAYLQSMMTMWQAYMQFITPPQQNREEE